MDFKRQVEQHLTADVVRRIYEDIQKQKGPNASGAVVGLCPFHDDKNSSFNYDIATGMHQCFSCGESGNIYTYLKKVKNIEKPLLHLAEMLGIEKPAKKLTIDVQIIKEAKANLLKNNSDKVRQLVSYGISEEIINKANIGYRNGRFWFPVKDEAGDFVNIRKYDPADKNKFISHSVRINGETVNFGQDRLYPVSALNSDTVYIFEGEKDTLVARSLGINGITNTTGAKSWSNEWSPKFRGKNVIICMDIDQAGKEGAQLRARKVLPFATQVKIVDLNLDPEIYPKGDFADYIMVEGRSKEEFLKLVDDSDVYCDMSGQDDTIYKVILAEASKAKYVNKKCHIMNVLCCGKDDQPYAAPHKILANCHDQNSSSTKCAGCSLIDGKFEYVVEADNPILLDFIRDNKQTVISRIKQQLGMRKNCTNYELEYTATHNIEKVRLVPDITYNIEENFEHVYRIGYYIHDGDNKMDTNQAYNIKAITCADNKTQYIQHHIYEIEASNTNIDDFELDEAKTRMLKKFQVTKGSIQNKLDSVYKEFSALSHIYGRQDVFLLCDLVAHSVITFDFQNKSIGKGWVEGAIVGDSAQGKSEIGKFMTHHYRSGEFVSGESASYAGLVGGLSQLGNNWQLQWGRIPINDKRWLIIDEATGLSTDDISKLSEIRSTGECKIQKIKTEATRARTRMLWFANLRKDNLGIKNYPYGVMAIKELFGQPEDVRRVDIAMTVASGEVDDELMNQTNGTLVPEYDSDACHIRLMFAWSRKGSDILITKNVEEYILKKARMLSKIYNSAIPLVEPADIRNKLARLTVSLAVILVAVNSDMIVVPSKDHVDYIVEFLQRIYNKPRFAYDDYSRKEFKKADFKNRVDACRVLNLNLEGNLEDLLESAIVSKMTISDLINSGGDDFHAKERQYRDKIRLLKRANALDEHERYFVLQPGFLDFLKRFKKYMDAGGQYLLFDGFEGEEVLD